MTAPVTFARFHGWRRRSSETKRLFHQGHVPFLIESGSGPRLVVERRLQPTPDGACEGEATRAGGSQDCGAAFTHPLEWVCKPFFIRTHARPTRGSIQG